jgi:hypothetical protein
MPLNCSGGIINLRVFLYRGGLNGVFAVKPKMLVVGALVFTLTACFLDDDEVKIKVPVADNSIYVLTVSGDMEALDGTLTRPCAKNAAGSDYLVTESISGASGVRTEYLYTSDDASCTGLETIDAVYNVTFSAGSVMAITGWHDLAGASVPPPQAQDNTGPLLENESVTSLSITINSIVPADPNIPPGTVLPSFYVIDDTVPFSVIAYGISDYDSQKAFDVPMVHNK